MSFCRILWFLVVFLGFPAGFPTLPALLSSLRFGGGVSVDRNKAGRAGNKAGRAGNKAANPKQKNENHFPADAMHERANDMQHKNTNPAP